MQVLALSRLVFEFAPQLEAFRLAVPDLLSTVMLLTEDPAREVENCHRPSLFPFLGQAPAGSFLASGACLTFGLCTCVVYLQVVGSVVSFVRVCVAACPDQELRPRLPGMDMIDRLCGHLWSAVSESL